jgi:hypothetical protein
LVRAGRRRIAGGTIEVDAEPVPLAEVESAWTARLSTGRRLVFVPWTRALDFDLARAG